MEHRDMVFLSIQLNPFCRCRICAVREELCNERAKHEIIFFLFESKHNTQTDKDMVPTIYI